MFYEWLRWIEESKVSRTVCCSAYAHDSSYEANCVFHLKGYILDMSQQQQTRECQEYPNTSLNNQQQIERNEKILNNKNYFEEENKNLLFTLINTFLSR